jgi:hypothetical protein
LPVALSCSALVFLLGYVAIFGAGRPAPAADEGAPARFFQLLMAVQVPIIATFAIRWLPRMPQRALTVLVLQLLAALVPVALVVILER